MIDCLLPKVKANLILQHDEDDELLRAYIAAALDYAAEYQHIRRRGSRMPNQYGQVKFLAGIRVEKDNMI